MPVLRTLMGRAIKSTDMPWDTILEGAGSATGQTVTPHTAMRVSAVYAAVRLLAESIGSLPTSLIRRQDGRRVVVDGDLSDLLTVQPNPEQDAPEFWRSIIGWMLLDGNSYAYVERDGAGLPIGLWPVPSDQVMVGRTPTRRRYFQFQLTESDPDIGTARWARVGPESMLHFRAFGTGVYGLSPIRQISEAIGTSLAAQEYMARFYAQDASPGGVVKVPGELTDIQFDRLKKEWQATHRGVKRSHLLAILEGGAEWQKVGLSPGDAAFIETQKWEVTEIARAFGVPPHLIGDVERSTSWGTGIAEQGIGFVTYTLTPWITRLEWVIRSGLLSEINPDLRLKWRVDALQRGDTKARYEGYQIGRNWGWLSANDIRTLEDLDPIDGGDVYLQPLNMIPADTVDDPGDEGQSQGPGRRRSSATRKRLATRFAPLIADADREIAELERDEVSELVRVHLEDRSRSPAAFGDEVRRLYEGTITERTIERWLPVFALLAVEVAQDAAGEVGGDPPDLERWVRAYVTSHVGFQTARAASKIVGLSTESDAPSAIRLSLDQTVDQRPSVTGRWESTQLSRASAREAWKSAGVREMVWSSSGGCDLCASLDGTVVGIEEAFATSGQQIDGGDKADLEVQRDTFHPPLHPGCDCDIIPG